MKKEYIDYVALSHREFIEFNGWRIWFNYIIRLARPSNGWKMRWGKNWAGRKP